MMREGEEFKETSYKPKSSNNQNQRAKNRGIESLVESPIFCCGEFPLDR
jgi:hypothetical protein